jgi:hypothetical protein
VWRRCAITPTAIAASSPVLAVLGWRVAASSAITVTAAASAAAVVATIAASSAVAAIAAAVAAAIAAGAILCAWAVSTTTHTRVLLGKRRQSIHMLARFNGVVGILPDTHSCILRVLALIPPAWRHTHLDLAAGVQATEHAAVMPLITSLACLQRHAANRNPQQEQAPIVSLLAQATSLPLPQAT